LIVSVRLMRADGEGRMRPTSEDQSLELAICA
jgi:hypothetical protein